MSDVHDDALDPDMLSAYLDDELTDAEVHSLRPCPKARAARKR